ncbi:carboxylic acid reductase [Mycobacterium sp. 852002-40037_SCH5390672]|uniref:carboxylic acid reductase n=1 Tax=Mycobacterium sp. 852002-40037_SCH5390672 TaxID=1834089 RepID=UPI0008056A1C|nr:carboxylic acid reductase [Mycobacterium sp. 852002-40037_SCH5390672]OBB93993.1 oxidoreductase [Mycobacterium sp. 852002-40037_SCH5390672]
MTETVNDSDREQRLAERVEQLYANDPQFRAAASMPEVTDAAHRSGLRLSEVVDTYLSGYADRPALGQRACEVVRDPASGRAATTLLSGFETITYRELGGRVAALAAAWQSDLPGGFNPGDFVSVLGFTSIDYVVHYLACIRLGAVFVPLQTSSTAAQLAPIVAETAPRILAVSVESLGTAVDLVVDAPWVERLVVFDYSTEDDEQRGHYDQAHERLRDAGHRAKVVSLSTELESGRGLPPTPAFVPADGENPLATLIYTSGSTGAPKGAMYTTDMMTRIWQRPHSPSVDIGRPVPAIHLQYMPLSHVYGLEWLIATLASGGIGYFAAKSDMSTLFDDISLVRPTALNLVPRVCDMFFRRYRKELDQRSGGELAGEQLDDMVKAELRQDFIGGRVISAMCGSAPLSKQMHAFMESLLDIPVADGYGATETGGGIMRSGRIRRPPVTDYKLVDVPELGYLTTDKPYPRGELHLKASNVIPGYFKHPELSAKIFDDEGFYKTGDIMAELGPDHLVYLDRSNNVIKLSQGEFVAVSQLEATFSTSPYIRQIFLYGSSEQPFLLAVIVPNDDAVGDGDARALIADSLQRIGSDARLHPYEIPRDFLLEPQRFTRDNGLLSGVGKLLRPALKAHYGERLDAMYDDIEASHGNQLGELRSASRELPTIDTVRRAAAATLGLPADTALRAGAKFIELGGDSLSAFSFATLLAEIFNIDVPVQTIVSPTANLSTVANFIDGERTSVSTRPTFASVHGRGATVARAADLTLDSFIDADTLAAAPRLPAAAGTVNTVLLTGANGYLGRFLCLDWLERLAPDGGTVICLARGADPTAGRQRIEAAIDSGDDELSDRFRRLADKHLRVLVGDVGAANLGLDTPTYERLAESVDLVVHSAALVNHVLPYSQLFGPNVVGTAEIIKLAITKRLKLINYISTVAVTTLPDGSFIGEDVDVRSASPSRSLDESYASGYATSKWAGEVLLREAHDLCGVPVAVFRSDMILAHSQFAGQLNVPDMFTRLILSVVATGLAPRSFYQLDASGNPQRAHYDGLPADFTAEAITALGARALRGYHTYNVLNTHDDGVSLDTFVDWLVAGGHPIERIDDYQQWLARFTEAMKALPENQRKSSLLPLMNAYAKPGQPTHGTGMPAEKFRAAVQSAGIGSDKDVPHVTEALIDKYVTDLQRLGLLSSRAGAHAG